MAVAQGINKISAYKAQTGLGVPAAGAGGQVLRRRTSVGDRKRATFVNDEIVQHQQSTGVNLATASTDWNFDGLLSPGTYAALMAALVRKDFVAGAAAVGLSLTVAVVGGGVFTVTRSGGSWLTDGVKVGDVGRITAGSYANAVNRDNNLLVTALTASVMTVVTLNGDTLVAEGPIASSTFTVIGKKTLAPLSGHTDKLFTMEEWFADISTSELYPDMRIGQADISLPASGNAGVKLTAMGLGVRTQGAAQVLTSPAPATTTPVLTAVRGVVLVNGARVGNVTGANLTIKSNLTPEGPVMGSNYSPDMARGRLEVSGSFTGLYDGGALATMFDNETITSMVVAMAADTTKAADFVTFSMSAIKLTSTTPDDGEKAIVRSYAFTAQLNAAGGAALASDQTIISIQDSQA